MADAPETGDVGEVVDAAWERHRERLFEGQRLVSDWLVQQMDLGTGQTILELTAGPGETGFLVAENLQSEVAGPIAILISSLPPDELDAVKSAVEAKMAPFRSEAGLSLPSLTIGVCAR